MLRKLVNLELLGANFCPHERKALLKMKPQRKAVQSQNTKKEK